MSFIEGSHPLLEPHSVRYSNLTVRRAFIVWMYCSEQNSFKDVCNYYHYLEKLEDTLPADQRAMSRHHEFSMLSNPPPTSSYLDQISPKLYSRSSTIHQYINKVEHIKNDPSFIKLDCLNGNKIGVTTNEVLNTSYMIKKYCTSHKIPLRKFLTEFKEYARKCELNYTVKNVAFYIKRKMVDEELLMVENYSKSFDFLNLNVVDSVIVEPKSPFDVSRGMKYNEHQLKLLSSIKSQKQISI